jgi:uncharacterized protein YdaU (DUF1376 family)
MNYYEHHIGDYLKATAHLSMLEDAAYRRLIDAYYNREAPLPTDRKACQKLARAQSKDERAAVDYVLDEFFALEDDGWHQKRCDAEIEKYQQKPTVEEKRESACERQRRARERRKQMFEQLRELGIVMPYDVTTGQLQDALSRATSQARHGPVTRDITATQTPDTSNLLTTVGLNDDDSCTKTHEHVVENDPVSERAIELAAMLRKNGAALTSADPHVRQWAASGVSDAQALTALETAKQNRADTASTQPINSGYLNAIITSGKQQFTPRAPGNSRGYGKPTQDDIRQHNHAVVEQFLQEDRRL